MTTAKPSSEYNINECPLDGVIVYQDRAEVTRFLSFIPSSGGEHELMITSLTMNVVSFFQSLLPSCLLLISSPNRTQRVFVFVAMVIVKFLKSLMISEQIKWKIFLLLKEKNCLIKFRN
jgi:hypothetical protein